MALPRADAKRSVALLVRGFTRSSGGVIVKNPVRHPARPGFEAEGPLIREERRGRNPPARDGLRLTTCGHDFLKFSRVARRGGRRDLYHAESHDLFGLMRRLRPFVVTVHDPAFPRAEGTSDPAGRGSGICRSVFNTFCEKDWWKVE